MKVLTLMPLTYIYSSIPLKLNTNLFKLIRCLANSDYDRSISSISGRSVMLLWLGHRYHKP